MADLQVRLITMVKLITTLHTFLLVFVTQGQLLSVEEPVRFLALGDSYTIGQSVSYKDRWPSQLADSLEELGYQVDTVAFISKTGWRTDDLAFGINQVQPDSNYNMVSLLIGVNNQYQGEPITRYTQEFPELLKRAIAFAGGVKERVFVVSIPDYMYTPTRNYFSNPDAVSRKLDEYNAIAEAYCDTLNIKYFNITPISRKGLNDPALVANDGLHPSGKQYGAWVDFILSQGIVTSGELTINDAKKSFLFFPNPATNTIIVEDQIIRWEILTSTGKVVLNGAEREINLEKTPSGSYLFRGYTDELNEVVTEKLSIKTQASY